jgi:hypothetical protein
MIHPIGFKNIDFPNKIQNTPNTSLVHQKKSGTGENRTRDLVRTTQAPKTT